ncbi:hypothetical protein [Alteromonas gracilis]|uniref:hypothetical protein n=1 Tax=Alteromonas gracilis TaxID=1479524 RepID=UPI00321922C5
MIVSQADYDRWQAMYSERNNDGVSGEGGNVSEANDYADGHNFATKAAMDGEQVTSTTTEERPKSFLEEAFERVLFNRLGVDQEKMDELKEEIEKTKDAIEALNEQKPHNENQKKQLDDLQAKLEKLEEALKALLRQANERANEERTLGQQSKLQSAGVYLSVSQYNE